MNNGNPKPLTDLQRIQQSYSSGSQTYTPVGNAPTGVTSEAPKESTRESQAQAPSQVSL